jgi:hypothetical protein
MKKAALVLLVTVLVSLATPLFSADTNPFDPEGACTMEIQGKIIYDSQRKVQGCVNGSPQNCTYTVTVPCD